ncbi:MULTISPECIES: serine hydrolase domain-containing protein [Vagococcus]|uniref:Beta-lactamase class C and other penicillin binding proteins n=1 Tax=Vagococcus fluvialis bH819 TaxID=1255619 RepID=A0A1X8XKY3_9ENTE|nr:MULTISPECIES: serine hydrolase domain-containing protein [Vagococcus]SLM84598.1 Beta-lactamase class C and other penicillin binding proteins [Vagococcus fluvialis bH819]HCM89938.1 serine hydrolase [Vagococcus sp.]
MIYKLKITAGDIVKKIVILCFFIVILPINAESISREQNQEIQTLLDDACRISKTPGVAVTVTESKEEFFFTSGYADREKNSLVDKETLFELASMSKAFTGLGILLLEEEGKLSLDDSIDKYLPELEFKFKGIPVDMKTLTVKNFLFHTSGLTNEDHGALFYFEKPDTSLAQTIDAFSTSELSFKPGERFQYGTMNYDILGRVIENVSHQEYSDFMTEKILIPLKLSGTYSDRQKAQSTEKLATGYHAYFGNTKPYNAPEFIGNRPAGYLISNSKDMARWLKIQMGVVQDIPDIFKKIVIKSHIANQSVPPVNKKSYSSGWFISEKANEIEHPGGNPNFVSRIKVSLDNQRAISVLANSNSMNVNLLNQIEDILNEKKTTKYKMSQLQVIDYLSTFLTLVALLLSILLSSLIFRKKYHQKNSMMKHHAKIKFYLSLFSSILLLIILISIGNDWLNFYLWQPISILTMVISSLFLTFLLTVYYHVPHEN